MITTERRRGVMAKIIRDDTRILTSGGRSNHHRTFDVVTVSSIESSSVCVRVDRITGFQPGDSCLFVTLLDVTLATLYFNLNHNIFLNLNKLLFSSKIFLPKPGMPCTYSFYYNDKCPTCDNSLVTQ